MYLQLLLRRTQMTWSILARQAELLVSSSGHGGRKAVSITLNNATSLTGFPAESLQVKLPAETAEPPCQMLLWLCRCWPGKPSGIQSCPPASPQLAQLAATAPQPTYGFQRLAIFWCLLMSKFQTRQVLCSFRLLFVQSALSAAVQVTSSVQTAHAMAAPAVCSPTEQPVFKREQNHFRQIDLHCGWKGAPLRHSQAEALVSEHLWRGKAA